MAVWSVWVKGTRTGEQRYHSSYTVKADTADETRRNAVAQAERNQLSYRDCTFSSTSCEKIREN